MRIFCRISVWVIIVWFFVHPMAYSTESETGSALLEKIESVVVIDRKQALTLLAVAEADNVIKASERLQSHLFNIKGYLDLTGNNYPSAVSYFQTARQLAFSSNNQVQQAESYRREGILLSILGQYSEALALLHKSLQIHLATGSPKAIFSLSSIVNIYELLNQDDLQMEYGWLLLEESIKFNNRQTMGVAHYAIGKVFLSKGDIEQAKYHLEQQKLSNQNNQYAFTYLTYEAAARLHKALNDLPNALLNIETAKSVVETSGLKVALPSMLIIESEIRLAMGQTELAIQLLNRAIFVAKEAGASYAQIESFAKLVRIYEARGEIPLALETIKRQQALEKESQVKIERQLLAINQARLDLDTKNREINSLKEQQKIDHERQTNQIALLTFTVIVIAILAFLTLRLRKQKSALRNASKEIQRATNAKSDFLARMSHEIRTPLNAVIGLTKLSLRSSEDQRQATNLKQIEESSHTLLALINDILDFSKIEAGKMTLESLPFNLDDVIDSSIRMNALKAQEKGLELIRFVGPDVPIGIEGDPLRLQQVLNNLLSNAVKFTSDGSVSIVVNRQYSEQDLLLQFEIRDTGRGLSTAQKASLFDSFSQADESITRKYGGTGLGLTISKQLVELMGGKIWVESVPSQGATFFFTLKTLKSAVPELQPEKGLMSPIRVLVIDADVPSSILLEQTLQRMEFNPVLAADGMTGIENMREAEQQKSPFDLIIIEGQLPDINGTEIVSIIRQEMTNDLPKIILMTSNDCTPVKSIGTQLEVDGYLAKPLNASAIFNCIIGIIKRPIETKGFGSRRIDQIPNWQHIHILLAEDNELNRKVAIGYLQDTHAKISIAENGDQAVSYLRDDNSIDIVLMDIQMPYMDGLTATQIIRNELGLNIPIIAMTAHAIDEDIEKSNAAGMSAHIIKPIEPQLLINTIQSLIDSR